MTDRLTRRAQQLTALYGVGAPVLATAIALTQGPGGWFLLTWFELLALSVGVYLIPLTALLWLGWAVFRYSRWREALVPFTLFGIVLPVAYHGALLLPGRIEHFWHGRQLARARIEAIEDETLFSAHGHPIGVRLTFRVNFPLGLNALGQQPPADSPAAGLYLPDQKSTLMYFANRDSNLNQVAFDGFPSGTTTLRVDAVPSFMPSFLQQPGAFAASDPRNLCFHWRSAAERERELAAAAQSVLLEIGPYGRYLQRGARGTAHLYRLADFYEGAKAEGALECR